MNFFVYFKQIELGTNFCHLNNISYLFDGHYPHSISGTTLRPPSGNNNNEIARIQQTLTFTTGNTEIDPLFDILGPWLGFFLILEPNWNQVSVNIALSDCLVISGDSENRAHRSVFSDEMSGFSGS